MSDKNEDCTCHERSWYGKDHDINCPLNSPPLRTFQGVFLLSNLEPVVIQAVSVESAGRKALAHYKPHKYRKHLVRLHEIIDGSVSPMLDWRPERYRRNKKKGASNGTNTVGLQKRGRDGRY